jgi:hypothetical protein
MILDYRVKYIFQDLIYRVELHKSSYF